MSRHKVSIVRFQTPLESVRRAVELSQGLAGLPNSAKVFLKPNVVSWTKSVSFPKWGVITTSRVVQDMVVVLKEYGIDQITIGEGMVIFNQKDRETPAHAFESLGYNVLRKRYGVEVVNVLERPFQRIDLGDGVELNFNEDMLLSDFVVNLPVLKTHAQTIVSLGMKNIKGLIDVPSRRKCHSPDPEKDLHYMVSKLASTLPPSFTLVDGIYSNERGPAFDGKIRRSDLLVASADVLSADKVAAKILGYEPSLVPHLVHAAARMGRPQDLSDVEVVGEAIEDVAMNLQYSFMYDESGNLPLPMHKMGIKGLSYPKYDDSLCTSCSYITGIVLAAIALAWKGRPWDDVEVLTGKLMRPTPGRNHTILFGKCMYQANKNHPDIKHMIAIKTCPPSTRDIVSAFHEAGIDVNPQIFEHLDKAPGFFMQKYEGKPEFDESLFRID